MNKREYDAAKTVVLFVDPYNDFLCDKGASDIRNRLGDQSRGTPQTTVRGYE
jgi:hypothetical protein